MDLIKFLKDCDAFFVITKNGDFPSARPFKAIMENKGIVYIATNTKRKAYRQILKDNHIHIVAIKRSTRTWIRFNAIAELITDIEIKKIFFKKFPRLNEIYKKPTNKILRVFELKISKLELHKD